MSQAFELLRQRSQAVAAWQAQRQLAHEARNAWALGGNGFSRDDLLETAQREDARLSQLQAAMHAADQRVREELGTLRSAAHAFDYEPSEQTLLTLLMAVNELVRSEMEPAAP